MAAKIKMLKLLLEGRGLAQITSRRPSLRAPGAVLLQQRTPAARAGQRRKRTITITTEPVADIPHPVKITHVRQARRAEFRAAL